MTTAPKYAPTVSGNTPFSALCRVLEKIHTTRYAMKTVKRTKEDILKSYIDDYRSAWPKLEQVLKRRITPHERGEDLFQLVRLLLPQLDRSRPAYNVKETRIAMEYVYLLGLKKDSKKAQELLTFKHADHNRGPSVIGKSFDTLIFELLSQHKATGEDLVISEINNVLDRMTHSHAEFRTQLKFLYSHCSALEHRWLVRIILRRSLKVRKVVAVVLNTIHPYANEMFAVNHDLEDICMTLHDYDLKVDRPRVTVGKPFGFMLSARTNLSTIESDMAGADFFMETKFDGERVQIHKRGSEFLYFSRGYGEYGQVYGETAADKRTLAEFLGRSIDPCTVTCILDGEMMSYDRQQKRLLPKGGPADVKRLHVDNVVHQQCFVAFDCLYHNGRLLTDEPLRERRRILESILSPIEGRVLVSRAEAGSTKEQVADFMKRAIAAKDEGIVVKRADSRYEPNHRDAGWVKLKPDYMNEVISDLDVLVVGAYFADARSLKAYDALLLAVAEDPEGSRCTAVPRTFYSFARVHSGLSREMLRRIIDHTGERWQPFDREKPPRWLKMSSMSMAPDVFIEPEFSVNVTVKAAEVVPNRAFMTGLTIKFGRITAVREDKPWSDCMTYSELVRLCRETGNKLVVGDVDNDLQVRPNLGKGKRKRSPQRKIKVQLDNQVVHVKRVKSDCLAGKEFCVLMDKDARIELEKAIKKHGGRCVLSPISGSTDMVVAEKLSLRVRELLKQYDVVKVTWLVECIDSGRMRTPGPADYFGMTPQTQEKMRLHFDRYGDPYLESITEGMLRNIMEDMVISPSVLADAYQRGKLSEELVDFQRKLLAEKASGFAGKAFYLEKNVDILWSLRIQANSGIVVGDRTKADFIVGDYGEDREDLSSDEDFKEEGASSGTKQLARLRDSDSPKKVSTSWVSTMIEGF